MFVPAFQLTSAITPLPLIRIHTAINLHAHLQRYSRNNGYAQRPRRTQNLRRYDPAFSARSLTTPAPSTAFRMLLLIAQLGSGLRVGIVHARWNTKIIDALLAGTKKALANAGVKDENIVIQSVPGSYELPYAVKQYVSFSS